MTDPNGLLYMRARFYNPYICRFINPDPAGFTGGLNWYCYATGNPINYLDPFGLCANEAGGRSWITGALETIANAIEDQDAADSLRQRNPQLYRRCTLRTPCPRATRSLEPWH